MVLSIQDVYMRLLGQAAAAAVSSPALLPK
jgi:hypothetical protein